MSKMAAGSSNYLRSPIFTKPSQALGFLFCKAHSTVATADKVRVLSVWYLVLCAFRKVVQLRLVTFIRRLSTDCLR